MFRKILQSSGTSGLLLALLVVLGLSFYRLYASYAEVRQEAINLERKINAVNETTTQLEQQNAQGNNVAFLEQQARLKLNYKKPDETVVFVYRNQYNPETEENNQVSSRNNQTTWHKFLNWLKNLKRD